MPVRVLGRLAVALLTLLRESHVLAYANQPNANSSILSKVASVNSSYELPKYSSAMERMDYFYHAKIMDSTSAIYSQLSSLLMEMGVSFQKSQPN